MTLGTFSAFLMLQGLFLTPLGSLLGAFGRLQYLGSHLGRLDDVMETPVEPSGARDPGPLTGAISLEEVSYRYAGTGDHAISGINLQVQPRDMVALVGPTGAGKSTLARLLLGMHIPDGGTIHFDGVDLRDLDLSLLRRQVGVVLQESFLFNDTVRANLSFNDPDLPLERLEEAARFACIHDVVEALPLGYGTVIGENGARISGGERQRLCLARALATRPAILLMDEATSALDPDTEALIHRNLSGLGCTRILIAHRLNTVREADLILVMDHGRMVQMGSFQGLLEEPGLFRALAKGTYEATI
jgi:ABC-type bacteriocin/lantibiotic exporter with double-glycine peptidase domain